MLWRLDRLNMIDSLQYFFIIWVFECFWVFRFTSVIFQRTLSFYHKFVQKYPLLYSHDVTHTLQFQCFKSITLNRYTQRNTNVLTCCLHEARIYSAFHDTKRQHTGRLQPYWLFVENVNSCALRNRCGFKHNTHKCGRCVGFQGLLLLVAKKNVSRLYPIVVLWIVSKLSSASLILWMHTDVIAWYVWRSYKIGMEAGNYETWYYPRIDK